MQLQFISCSALLVLGVIAVASAGDSGTLRYLKRAGRQRRQTEAWCDGSVTSIQQPDEIRSFNYPAQYPQDDICQWQVTAPIGKVVWLRFINFDIQDTTDCTNDYLKVYNGRNALADRITTICGSDSPPVIKSSDRFMFIKFVSDSSGTGGGFRISVSFMNATSPTSLTQGCTRDSSIIISGDHTGDNKVCGQRHITSSSSIIQFPIDSTWSSKYTENFHCSWLIEAPYGKAVKVTTTEEASFNLDDKLYCSYEELDFRDGVTSELINGHGYCGKDFPSEGVKSFRNTIKVDFYSTDVYSTASFSLTVEFVTSDRFVNESLEGSSGQFRTPTYNNLDEYPNYADGNWLIDVGNDKRVKLEFIYFELEDWNCQYDVVTIYDGANRNSPIIGSFCGYNKPTPIVSTGKNLFVVFRSDSGIQKRGFAATYKAVDTVEAGAVRALP